MLLEWIKKQWARLFKAPVTNTPLPTLNPLEGRNLPTSWGQSKRFLGPQAAAKAWQQPQPR